MGTSVFHGVDPTSNSREDDGDRPGFGDEQLILANVRGTCDVYALHELYRGDTSRKIGEPRRARVTTSSSVVQQL
jgi:hypothetical protein